MNKTKILQRTFALLNKDNMEIIKSKSVPTDETRLLLRKKRKGKK